MIEPPIGDLGDCSNKKNTNFTKKEKEIITRFDYQIFNNGINALYYNNCYRQMFDYVSILEKEGSEISMEVSNIIKRAFILMIELNRFGEYTDTTKCGLSEKISAWKNELENIEKRYCFISEEFLSKFGI